MIQLHPVTPSRMCAEHRHPPSFKLHIIMQEAQPFAPRNTQSAFSGMLMMPNPIPMSLLIPRTHVEYQWHLPYAMRMVALSTLAFTTPFSHLAAHSLITCFLQLSLKIGLLKDSLIQSDFSRISITKHGTRLLINMRQSNHCWHCALDTGKQSIYWVLFLLAAISIEGKGRRHEKEKKKLKGKGKSRARRSSSPFKSTDDVDTETHMLSMSPDPNFQVAVDTLSREKSHNSLVGGKRPQAGSSTPGGQSGPQPIKKSKTNGVSHGNEANIGIFYCNLRCSLHGLT
jgi:hypothetical protein